MDGYSAAELLCAAVIVVAVVSALLLLATGYTPAVRASIGAAATMLVAVSAYLAARMAGVDPEKLFSYLSRAARQITRCRRS